jgi:2'-5' RNA ligase
VSGKTHHTAAAVVPPEEVWEPVQAIRRRHDRQIRRWPPHCNLLYPFRRQAEFPALAPALRTACAALAPFSVSLGEFRLFRHGSGRCTLWLAPEPAEALRRLQAALQAVCPDCEDLGRFPDGFTPHLSVGQFPTLRDCERARERLQAGWRPISFVLNDVALLARDPDGPFRRTQRVTLGGPTAFAPSRGE